MISRKVCSFTSGNLRISAFLLCLDCASPHLILLCLCVPLHLHFCCTVYLSIDPHPHCLLDSTPLHLILLFLCVPPHLRRLLHCMPMHLRLLFCCGPLHLCLLQCCIPPHLCCGSPADLRIEPNYQSSNVP